MRGAVKSVPVEAGPPQQGYFLNRSLIRLVRLRRCVHILRESVALCKILDSLSLFMGPSTSGT